jgi:hypothetical protein
VSLPLARKSSPDLARSPALRERGVVRLPTAAGVRAHRQPLSERGRMRRSRLPQLTAPLLVSAAHTAPSTPVRSSPVPLPCRRQGSIHCMETAVPVDMDKYAASDAAAKAAGTSKIAPADDGASAQNEAPAKKRGLSIWDLEGGSITCVPPRPALSSACARRRRRCPQPPGPAAGVPAALSGPRRTSSLLPPPPPPHPACPLFQRGDPRAASRAGGERVVLHGPRVGRAEKGDRHRLQPVV